MRDNNTDLIIKSCLNERFDSFNGLSILLGSGFIKNNHI